MQSMEMHQSQLMRFARALFDNFAEMPRELSFKKGDILTVLQEKYENNSEWWVCSLRNMVGLAPANRLEAMPILMEANPKFKTEMSGSLYDELPDTAAAGGNINYFNLSNSLPQTNKEPEFYSVYQIPNDELYSNPLTDRSAPSDMIYEQSVYQIPIDESRNDPSAYFNIPESSSNANYSNIAVDIGLTTVQNNKPSEYYNNRYDYSDSFSDTTSTSFTDTVGSSLNSFNQLSISSSESGDFRIIPSSTFSPLRLSQDDAISRFRQHQTETAISCNKVIEFAKAKWKSEEMLKPTIKSIKIAFLEMFQNLQHLSHFSSCILENSKACGDVNLTKKIWKHLQPIQEAIITSKEALDKLEAMGWSPDKIATSVRLAFREGADSLSHVVSAARNVLIHIRSLSVTISGNANVLFPDSLIDMTLKSGGSSFNSTQKTEESANDKANLVGVMKLFGQQMKSQTENVNETVNDFIKILSSQNATFPSKETVISHSKFVVRSATQLVYIAKNLTDAQIKTIPNQKIEEEGNNLCNLLKTMVSETKELVTSTYSSSENFEHLIGLLKSVNNSAKNLQKVLVDSVT